MVLANYSGTVHELFTQCESILGHNSALITDIDDYWGYLNGDVWTWIENNKVRTS